MRDGHEETLCDSTYGNLGRNIADAEWTADYYKDMARCGGYMRHAWYVEMESTGFDYFEALDALSHAAVDVRRKALPGVSEDGAIWEAVSAAGSAEIEQSLSELGQHETALYVAEQCGDLVGDALVIEAGKPKMTLQESLDAALGRNPSE